MAELPYAFNELPIGIFDAMIMRESSNNPNAVNPNSGARGLGQIMPVVIKDWNKDHPGDDQMTFDEMTDPQKNMRVSHWYMYQRIPQLLRNNKVPVTTDNVLASYNWGPTNVIKKGSDKAPTETVNYIRDIKALINNPKFMETIAK